MSSPMIDAVITWVDGLDPQHVKKREAYLTPDLKLKLHPEAFANHRFENANELYYCVQSILKFAPWIRTIFIVTDNQMPTSVVALCPEKIKIIDHTHLFKNNLDTLPTFNSLSIESLIFNIDELSEQFIYFNDDFFFIAPTQQSDFFKAQLPIISAKIKRQNTIEKKSWLSFLFNTLGLKKSKDNPHRHLQERCARLLNLDKNFLYLPHHPFPMLKSEVQKLFHTIPEVGLKNITYRFRNSAQYWIISVFYHEQWLKNKLVLKHQPEITINPLTHSDIKIEKKLSSAKRDKAPFLCIQNLNEASKKNQKFLTDWLANILSQ